MKRSALCALAALAAGAAIGYFAASAGRDAASAPVEKTPPARGRTPIADRGAEAQRNLELATLRARIRELEKTLADRAAATNAAEGIVAAAAPERRGPPDFRAFRENLEKLKREDPKKFAEMEARRAQHRQRRLERTQAKIDFLSSVDASGMSDEQKKTHERYQELLARREELREKMQDLDLSSEEREQTMREMRETDHALRDSALSERATLLSQTVTALGFSGDDAAAVSATLADIVTATESSDRGMPPPPGNAPGPGPR